VLPRPAARTLGEPRAALVYDSSVTGATSPILGQRYRLELAQTAGSLTYTGVLADYRRYFMPARPFTVALRGLHYGRYGRDGEDDRLAPMYIGYPGLVRGYEIESFDARDCIGDASGSCRSFDQLVGTRMAVLNAELRFPLLGLFGGRSYYGAFPIELAVFGDAGTAWTSSAARPRFLGGDRDWVRSAGAALRVNAFGYAVFEIDYVRPFDRPERGWHWQFNLTPGF
jgi:outer membrane protein assembly factor BamA